MRLVTSIVRPDRVDVVKGALGRIGVNGMTVKEYSVSLLPKMQLETVVADNMVDDVVKAIIQAARMGELGDGRVFVIPVERGNRIRTGEMELA